MTRNQWIGAAVVGLIVAFLIGFVPMWSRTRTLDRHLEETRFELELYRIQSHMGAALAEAQRSNYERARQLMTQVFASLQDASPQIADPQRRQGAEAVLGERDEIITQLSRAEPESTQRLMLLYTRLFAAIDPLGRNAPASVTPPTP
jgi:hypothetical protein